MISKGKNIFSRYRVFYLILNGLAIYVFSKIAGDYFDKEGAYRLDLWLDGRIHLIWRPWLNQLMVFITNIFSPEVLFIAALAACFYFLTKRRWYAAGLIFMSTAGGLILNAILKRLINRPRPDGGLTPETSLSFPSGHALMALIFFSLILFFFVRKIRNKKLKYLFILSNLSLIVLIGFSRLYLKVHWFSDVIAGLALGLFWLTFLILTFRVISQFIKNPQFKKHPAKS